MAAHKVDLAAAVALRVASAKLDIVGPVPGDETVGISRLDGELTLWSGWIEPPDLDGMALLLAVEYGSKTAAAAIQVRPVDNHGAGARPRIDGPRSNDRRAVRDAVNLTSCSFDIVVGGECCGRRRGHDEARLC